MSTDINSISNRTIIRILAMVTLFVGVLYAASVIHRELVWFAAALFFAVALDPAVNFFQRRMPCRSRVLAVSCVFVVVLLALALIFGSFIPPLLSQSRGLVEAVPSFVHRLESNNGATSQFIHQYNLADKIQSFQDQAISHLSESSGSVAGVVTKILSGFTALVTILVLTFFMLLEGPYWLGRFWAAIPSSRRRENQKLAALMYQAVAGYINGLAASCAFAGITTAVMLQIIGVPYAIPLGVLVALLDLLPLVGGIIGATIVVLICLFTSFTAALVMLIFFIILYAFENNVLRPIIYGKTVGISPLLVLITVIVGTALAGFVGALVSIPVAASVQIIIREYGLPGLSHPNTSEPDRTS